MKRFLIFAFVLLALAIGLPLVFLIAVFVSPDLQTGIVQSSLPNSKNEFVHVGGVQIESGRVRLNEVSLLQGRSGLKVASVDVEIDLFAALSGRIVIPKGSIQGIELWSDLGDQGMVETSFRLNCRKD